MSWVTDTFHCEHCNTNKIEMHRRSERPDELECKNCGNMAYRRMGGNICRVSYPDGTTDRFRGVKEQRKLLKAERVAKRARNSDELTRIAAEKRLIADKSPRQISNICKAEPNE